MLRSAAARFDPNLFLLDSDLGGADAPDPIALIGEWRSFSFDLGIKLARAENEDDRQNVVAEIERTAAAAGAVLVAFEAASGSSELASALAVEAGGSSVGFLDRAARLDYCSR